MKEVKQGLSRIATLAVLVIVILVTASFLAVYFAGLVHIGSSRVKLIGACGAATYFLPDTIQISVTNVSIVSNGTTSYYQSTSTIYPSTETFNSTTYSIFLFTNTSTSFITSNTTYLPVMPSSEWIITICTFAP